eukprot:15461588-Alexandrium_andersonii.AAC.1
MGHIYEVAKRLRYPETPAQAKARREAQGYACREYQDARNALLRGAGAKAPAVSVCSSPGSGGLAAERDKPEEGNSRAT